MTKPEPINSKNNPKYMDALKMVSDPRSNIDADGDFVGYGALEDHLEYYRDAYFISEEEYQQLLLRLQKEKKEDPNYHGN